MNQQIDIQEAFDALTKQHADLTFAFYGFASLVSGYMTSGVTFDAESLADEYEHLAEQAGQQLARVSGGAGEPNLHLQFLANTMRNLGKPPPLTLVSED